MKKAISFVLAVALLLCVLPLGTMAAPVNMSGDTGDCQWNLVDGVMTISGEGRMEDYWWSGMRPWQWEKITKVVIEEGVTYIGESAFCDLTTLTEVVIPNTVERIGYSAFAYTGLKEVTIPAGVKYISPCAFEECELRSVTLNEGLETIDGSAFSGNDNLKSIHIPSTVTGIFNGAFAYCTSLENISVASNSLHYATLDGVLFDRQGTTLMLYPAGKPAAAYTVPGGVQTIDSNAFAASAVTAVTLPASVKAIGYSAFYSCKNLKSFTIPETVTEVAATYFPTPVWRA